MARHVGLEELGILQRVVLPDPGDIRGRIVLFRLNAGIDLSGTTGNDVDLHPVLLLEGGNDRVQIVRRGRSDQHEAVTLCRLPGSGSLLGPLCERQRSETQSCQHQRHPFHRNPLQSCKKFSQITVKPNKIICNKFVKRNAISSLHRGGWTSRQKDTPGQRGLEHHQAANNQSSMSKVPATIRTSPMAERLPSRSWKTTAEKAMVTSMLSLSIGTTTLASPSCSAL